MAMEVSGLRAFIYIIMLQFCLPYFYIYFENKMPYNQNRVTESPPPQADRTNG